MKTYDSVVRCSRELFEVVILSLCIRGLTVFEWVLENVGVDTMHITVVYGNLGVFLPEGHNLVSEQLVVVRGDFVELSQTAIAVV